VAASGDVTECRQVFSVGLNGVGYFWECRATVRVDEDGRVVQAILYHSIATPDDIGHRIDLREACVGRDHTRCSYGRPVSWWLSLIVTIILWIGRIAFLFVA
jgi:hypothetical protein